MIYILVGLVFAVFFVIGAVTVYGSQGLPGNPWVDYVFWWLIGTGVLLAVAENLGRLRLRLGRWWVSGPGAVQPILSH